MEPITPVGYIPQSPDTVPVVGDRPSECEGCSYLRHGLTCRDGQSGGCLRADMKQLEDQWHRKRDISPAHAMGGGQ